MARSDPYLFNRAVADDPAGPVNELQTATRVWQGRSEMTTRGRIARGEHQQEFEGHVQHWVKQWEPLGGTSKVKVLKWVPTGTRLLRAP